MNLHIRRVFAAILLSIALPAIAHAQDFIFANVDVSAVEGDPIESDAARLDGDPFWETVSPYFREHGICRSPLFKDLDADQTAIGLDYHHAYAALGAAAFENAFEWMSARELYPFEHIQIESIDPRTSVVPVFCNQDGAPYSKKLRPTYFDFKFVGVRGAYFFADETATLPQEFDAHLVFLSAILRSLELFQNDVNHSVFLSGDTPYAGGVSDTQFREGALEKARWLTTGLRDAATIRAYEDLRSPSFGDYENRHEQLAYLLRPAIDPLNVYDSDQDGQLFSPGGFFYYLLGDHLGDRFDLLPELTRIAFTEVDLVKSLDELIDKHDGDLHSGLEHALPSYAAHYLEWANSRFPSHVKDDRWVQDAFGGCQTISVDETAPYGSVEVSINPYAATCLKVRVSAQNAEWRGHGHIRTEIADKPLDDDRIDDVFLALSSRKRQKSIGGASSSSVDLNCYTFMKGLVGTPSDCLMIPSQGRKPQSVLQRYYHIEVEDKKVGDFTELRLTGTYVPSEHPTEGAPNPDPVKVKITVSFDVVVDQGNELLDFASLALQYGSKVDFAPVTPPVSKTSTGLDDAVLDGRGTAIDPGLLNTALAGADNQIGVFDDDGTQLSFQVNEPMIFDDKVTGEVKVIPVFAMDGMIAAPDGSKPSVINVIEHDEDTLIFEAEANLCMVELNDLPRLLQKERPDYCEDGQRETIRSKGAIGFPDAFRSETKLEVAETENYLALRKLRLDRLQQRMRQAGLELPTPQNKRPSPTDHPRDQTPDRAREIPQSCSIKLESGACDCSCRAKACFGQRQDQTSLPVTDKSCRLTCGKKWAQCSP